MLEFASAPDSQCSIYDKNLGPNTVKPHLADVRLPSILSPPSSIQEAGMIDAYGFKVPRYLRTLHAQPAH